MQHLITTEGSKVRYCCSFCFCFQASCSFHPYLVFLDTPSQNRRSYTGKWLLNKAAVSDASQLDYWYPHPSEGTSNEDIVNNPGMHVRIVTAESRANEPLRGAEQEQAIIIGFVTGYKTPNINGTLNGLSVTMASSGQTTGQKRVRNASSSLTSHQKILMMADCFPRVSSSFCLVLAGSKNLYNSCGQSSSAKDIRLGDVLGIYEPEISTRRLGNHIPIFVDWNRIVIFRRNVTLPHKTIKMSSVPNQTINFYKEGATLLFSSATMLSGTDVKCFGTTCDRQDPSCNGCHNGPTARRNFVLRVFVEIENEFDYNSQSGVAAFTFRSYTLTEFFVDTDSFQHLDYTKMTSNDQAIRNAVRAIQNYVNNHGGWTVSGWHRRGQISSMEDGTLEINANTVGHLTRVEPTRSTDTFRDALKPLRFEAPRN